MTSEERHKALREIARGLERIDVEVYDSNGRDPLDPILGGGPADAPVAVIGRDPGRDEVKHGMPFIGAGGQKVRRALHEVVHGAPLPSFEASVAVGRHVFWANTVPWKPIGNKAWSARVRKAVMPYINDMLVHDWSGTHIMALGRVAFFWFGQDRETKQRLNEHWAREDRFETGIELLLTAPDGANRLVQLYAIPHPSPLNATWAPHVPRLLRERFSQVGLPRHTIG